MIRLYVKSDPWDHTKWIDLTEKCATCDGDGLEFCCNRRGEHLTEAGKELLRFLKKYLLNDAE
jgi:hypothetical protein